MRSVAIIGAGISGLVAAWALEEMGIPFFILDKGPAEALPRLARGCVYFHDRCNLPASAIRSQIVFTTLLPSEQGDALTPAQAYHTKVWGDRPYISNSVERFVSAQRAQQVATQSSIVWSMNDALCFLTERYRDKMSFADVTRGDILSLAQTTKVISTIPLYVVAPAARCDSTPLYIFQGEAGYTVNSFDDALAQPTYGRVGHVFYNVDPNTAWYRLSCMFGYLSIEFATNAPGWPLTQNRKIVTSPDADAFEREHHEIMLSGRWGRWARGVLGHETYHAVKEIFTTGRWA